MKALTFEEAIKKLESIVDELQEGELSLEKAIKKYEEGMKLAKFCKDELNKAEKKVQVITKTKTGNFSLSTLDEENVEGNEDKK